MQNGDKCSCGCELVVVELQNDLRPNRFQAALAILGGIAGGLAGFLTLRQERITGLVVGLVAAVVCGTFIGGLPLMFQPARRLIITRHEVAERQRSAAKSWLGTGLLFLLCALTVVLLCLMRFPLDSPILIMMVIGAVISMVICKVLNITRAELAAGKCSNCQTPISTDHMMVEKPDAQP